jgi:hypothetical protein
MNTNETQYVILGSTLDATADAIREQTHKTEYINPLDFPEEILGIDLTTEEYMRLSDLLEYPLASNEAWYVEEKVAKVDALIEHFENLGGDANGE